MAYFSPSMPVFRLWRDYNTGPVCCQPKFDGPGQVLVYLEARLERSLDGLSAWTQIAAMGANVTGYADTGLAAGTTYYYRVRAFDTYTSSNYSNVAQATTPSGPGPLVFGGYQVDDDNLGDSAGNGDGTVDCGETIELYVRVRNEGSSQAEGVDVQISTSDPEVSILYNQNSGYGFFITQDGRYAVYRYERGVPFALQAWASSSAITQGSAWNILRVVATGPSLSLYINGSLVWNGNDAAFASGRVGLAVYRDADSTSNRLWVDWARLVPTATAAAGETLAAEQRALNEAADQVGGTGTAGQAPGQIEGNLEDLPPQ
jgi:hypothetical protein